MSFLYGLFYDISQNPALNMGYFILSYCPALNMGYFMLPFRVLLLIWIIPCYLSEPYFVNGLFHVIFQSPALNIGYFMLSSESCFDYGLFHVIFPCTSLYMGYFMLSFRILLLKLVISCYLCFLLFIWGISSYLSESCFEYGLFYVIFQCPCLYIGYFMLSFRVLL